MQAALNPTMLVPATDQTIQAGPRWRFSASGKFGKIPGFFDLYQ